MKRIIALTLALACLFCLTACRKDQSQTAGMAGTSYAVSAADADVWCVLASTQVLATEGADRYAEARQDKIYLDAAKNEYETAQIIVSAKKDLKYTVSVSDLQHTEDAGAVIPSENCTVYIQKYVGISTNYHGNGAPTGKYPDALLPQANAVEYEQNIVTAGENGGAWLSFFIPADAKTGNYTGKATVDLGNEQVSVDISLKVYNVVVPDETTSKALFTINGGMLTTYELDSTGYVNDQYIQFLIDHRLAPTGFSARQELAEEGDSNRRVWAKTAYYWYEKGMRTIGIEAGQATVDGYPFLHVDTLTGNIRELAKISLEKNVDLVSLAAVYDWPIDEPFYVQYTAEHVQHNIDKFNEIVNGVADELAALDEFHTEMGQTIIESVRNIPHVITDYYGNEFRVRDPMVFQDGTPFSYEGQNVALCPKFNDYNTAEQRAQYDLITCEEKWWYGCNDPSYPYPSYHTDDTPVSAAAIGWMMADYGVTGNLYWAVNNAYVNNKPVEDPYSVLNTHTGANGEGNIIYPGKMYGVDGPVGSVRTSAILDGNEDYELIKYVQQAYAQKGLNADDIIERMTASVYTGTKVLGSSAEFEEARKLLLTVAEACASDTELMIASAEEIVDATGRKTYAFTIHTADGVQLYQGDTLLTATDGSYYVICNLEDVKNYLSLKAVGGSSETLLSIYLGGMQKLYNADGFGTESFTGTYTATEYADGIYRFTFSGIEDNKITFDSGLLQDISKETLSYILKLHNYGEEAQYKIYVTYADFGRVEFRSGTLQNGDNELNLDNFATVNWERNGALTGMEIVITGTDSVGISQIIVYGA